MNKLTIFNTYVKVTDQPQADRLKAVCEKYGLSYDKLHIDFWNVFKYNNVFGYYPKNDKFCIHISVKIEKTEVNIPKFIALCEEWVKENNK